MAVKESSEESDVIELEKEIVEKEVEKRQEYIDFLEEEGFVEEELEQLSNKDLEKLYISRKKVSDIEEDASRKTMLVNRLDDKGFDREMLEKSSLSDLEHVWDKVSGDFNTDSLIKKFENEAKRDFSSIMVDINSVLEEEEREVSGKVKNLSSKLSQIFDFRSGRSEKGGTTDMRKHNLKAILESYKELDPVESFVKSCFVVKSYLEYGIEPIKQMDFEDMAEQIPETHEELKILEDVFMRRHERRFDVVDGEYTETVITKLKDIIDHIEFSER